MKTLICDCNRTMPLDTAAIARALATTPGARSEGLETTHSLLCRREAPAFQRAAKAVGPGDRLIVACTQEARLFTELNDATVNPVGQQTHQDVSLSHPGLQLRTTLTAGEGEGAVRSGSGFRVRLSVTGSARMLGKF